MRWFRWLIVGMALLVAVPGIALGASVPAFVAVAEWRVLTPAGREHAVHLPAHLDDLLPDHRSTYQLRADVPLPEEYRGKRLTLVFPALPARARLFLGADVAEPLDPLGAGDYRSNGLLRFRIPEKHTAGPRLALALEVEHTWTQSAWLDAAPRLSATAHGDDRSLLVHGLNRSLCTTAFVIALLLSLSYGILFFFGEREGTAGWFVLEAGASASYPAFLMGITQPIFGAYDVGFMAVCMTTATFASLQFVHGHCGLGPHHRAWTGAFLVVLATSLGLFGPFTATRFAAPPVLAFLASMSLYQAILFVKLVRAGRPAHVWLVPLAFPLANAFGIVDFTAWLGLGEILGGVRFGLGPGVVGIVQSVAMTREFLLSSRRSDLLNVELEGRVRLLEASHREIVLLNDELKRQVTTRSDDLLEALGRMALPGQRQRELARGTIVADRYRVVRTLGSGGMGVVYEAQRLADGRPVALKALVAYRELTELQRFVREAKIVARLSHPHVVTILDVDVTPAGFLYIAMELLDPLSLQDRDFAGAPLAWKLSVLRQVAEALETIHEQRIVHRDLKPGNVLFVPGDRTCGPTIKVTDFGISSVVEAEPPRSRGDKASSVRAIPARRASESTPPPASFAGGDLTVTGDLLGTPLYMAPELGSGARTAGPPADVFSLGVMAYELLTGAPPYARAAVLMALAGERLPATPSLEAFCPTLLPELARALEACVAEDPETRPSAGDVARALALLENLRASGDRHDV